VAAHATANPATRPRRKARSDQAIVPLDDKRQIVPTIGSDNTSRGVGPAVLLPM
jgi:hypothetical protein